MSSSLIRQDLVPMIGGYTVIMAALAVGLRIVQRSGKARSGAAAGANEPARTGTAADASQTARASQVTDAAAATGAAGSAGGRRPDGPQPSARASEVMGRTRLRALAWREPGWRRLAVFSLSTAVGGYLLLMAVIIAYYYGVARVAGNFVHSAFSGCAMLIGLAAPVFIALSWLAERKGWRI